MTRNATNTKGSRANCNHGQVRISIIVDQTWFDEIKASAIENERAIPAEIRFRLKQTLEART